MTCFCDIRVGGHSYSKVLYDTPTDPVFFSSWRRNKRCRAGENECPNKCWQEVRNALADKNVLKEMCRDYTNVEPPNGITLFGYVKISNCGKQDSFRHNRKLCCHQEVVPVGVIKIGYFCDERVD